MSLLRAPWEVISSFLTARRMAGPRLSRPEFERWQARALSRWLARDLPKARFYQAGAGRLSALPVTDKATLMADFAAFNRAGITADQVRAALLAECKVGAHTVGASTGTSGNRGYFVISDHERYRWLGSLLGKALPDLIWQRLKVAVVLPQNTRLYDSARRAGRIDLRFFDITRGPEAFGPELIEFSPDVLVAPPRLLRWLAEHQAAFAPKRVFSAAETLDPADRPLIEAWAGQPLRQIYMATEGLLAVSCAHGTLHLAEDSVFFEFEPVGEGLVSPLITAFRREAQIMARYRMNDLLRLADQPCACGSPLRAVAEVVGRMDDCFRLSGQLVTPDALRNALVGADVAITDYRLIQHSAAGVELLLPPDLPAPVVERAGAALRAFFAGRGLEVALQLRQTALPLDPSRKLRRVECRLP